MGLSKCKIVLLSKMYLLLLKRRDRFEEVYHHKWNNGRRKEFGL